jgi:hypothetical protein
VRVLRSVYEFITGGSIAAPVALACGIAATLLFPQHRALLLAGFIAFGFAASTFEPQH